MAHSSHGGDVDGLSLYRTTLTDSLGVLSWTSILDSLDEHTEWVLTCHEVNELESLLDNETGLLFFTAISAVEHEGIDKSLDDWALCLSEFQNLISTSSVWDKNLRFNSLEGNVLLEHNGGWDIGSGLLLFTLSVITEVLKVVLATVVLPSAEELWLDSEKWWIFLVF